MFTQTFEKVAIRYLPGQQTASRVGGKILRAAGRGVQGLHAGTGRALQSKGGDLMHHSAQISADKAAKSIKADLSTKNKALSMQGKPALKINDKAIHRSTNLKAGKDLENQLHGVAGKGSEVKKKNFIQKHPYISAAGAGYAGYKLSQPGGPQAERGELGQ